MPSAPLLRAANASSGVSAFAITCICNSKLIQQALHVFMVHQIASSSTIAANFVKYYSTD
jgi:fructoselysine-6-P-deglycase FrlB-like protein